MSNYTTASNDKADDSSCVASYTKSKRRSRKQIDAIKDAIYEQLKAEQPATVRHVFYLVANNTKLIGKTEAEYQRTIVRLLVEMRLEGRIPWHWIADSTRWMRKPRTWSSIESAINRTAETYRRAMWDTQPNYIEVWCEKDAITGTLYSVTESFDVPLMPCRGYSSLTFLQSAAANIADIGKPARIFYVGDHDPSGHDISRNVEVRLREFAPDAEIHFERLAVTEDQIAKLSLPTRPTKKTDTRAKGFEGDSVDVDAIPPTVLRQLVEDAITNQIDSHTWNQMCVVEEQEREHIKRMTQLIGGQQ